MKSEQEKLNNILSATTVGLLIMQSIISIIILISIRNLVAQNQLLISTHNTEEEFQIFGESLSDFELRDVNDQLFKLSNLAGSPIVLVLVPMIVVHVRLFTRIWLIFPYHTHNTKLWL